MIVGMISRYENLLWTKIQESCVLNVMCNKACKASILFNLAYILF